MSKKFKRLHSLRNNARDQSFSKSKFQIKVRSKTSLLAKTHLKGVNVAKAGRYVQISDSGRGRYRSLRSFPSPNVTRKCDRTISYIRGGGQKYMKHQNERERYGTGGTYDKSIWRNTKESSVSEVLEVSYIRWNS